MIKRERDGIQKRRRVVAGLIRRNGLYKNCPKALNCYNFGKKYCQAFFPNAGVYFVI